MDAEPSSDREFYEAEVVDGELVEHAGSQIIAADPVAGARAGLARSSAPKLQTAAAAATGFLAGAAALALVRRYGLSKLDRLSQREQLLLPEGRRADLWPAAAGATYLVHVRPLIRPE